MARSPRSLHGVALFCMCSAQQGSPSVTQVLLMPGGLDSILINSLRLIASWLLLSILQIRRSHFAGYDNHRRSCVFSLVGSATPAGRYRRQGKYIEWVAATSYSMAQDWSYFAAQALIRNDECTEPDCCLDIVQTKLTLQNLSPILLSPGIYAWHLIICVGIVFRILSKVCSSVSLG